MTGLVLAAGFGKRLAPLTEERPKALIELGGRSLLARLLDGLAAAGVSQTAIVVGYRQEMIRSHLGPAHRGMPLRYLENRAYMRGPRLSLWTGRAELERDDVVLADGDVLFAPPLLERVIHATSPNVFLAEPDFLDTGEEQNLYLVREETDGAGETVAAGDPADRPAHRVVALRRGVMGPPGLSYDSKAEWVGFVKVSRTAGIALARTLDGWVAEGRVEGDYEVAIDALLSDHRFTACPTGGLPWIEIDFPQDLIAAETEVLPRLGQGR